jgi:hypothetical protein
MSTGNTMVDLLGLLLIGFGVLFIIVLAYAVYSEIREYRDKW